ncbi:MAG: AAA family ATPase [Victivallaceae bacterium]
MNLSDLEFLPASILNSPLLTTLIDQEIITNQDILFAYSLLKDHPHQSSSFFFLVYLSVLHRNGHSCLSLEETDDQSIGSLLGEKQIKRGVQDLPEIIKKQHLYISYPFVFLKKIYELEKQTLNNIKTIIQLSPEPHINNHSLPDYLTDEQKHVIDSVLRNSISFIYGGPGTGKTFVVIEIITQFLEEHPSAKIIVACPTGKSTSNIKQLLTNRQSVTNADILVRTIHSLITPDKNKLLLNADLIIIDEASMISLDLINLLLNYIPNKKRLILTGDPNQLSPIGVGNIFFDLIKLFPQLSYRLNINQRTSCSLIQELAYKILIRETIETLPLPNQKIFLEKVFTKFRESEPGTFCVLTPLKQGYWGTEFLNKKLYELFSQKIPSGFPIPIIITENLPNLDIYNGDTGILCIKDNSIRIGKRLFSSQLLEDKFSLNYVTSVHKSQGSEYENVLLILPQGSENFSSDLIYTGITRAKKTIEIWSHSSMIDLMIKKEPRKKSGFSYKIHG